MLVRGLALQQVAQGLAQIRRAVQGHQDLHQSSGGFGGLRQGLAPGFRGLQRRLTCAGLDGQLDRTPVEAFVFGAPSAVQQDLVRIAQTPGLSFQLTDQQLVEHGRI